MGSEWSDKHDKTGFGSVIRVVILTVWALGWFELRNCSPYGSKILLPTKVPLILEVWQYTLTFSSMGEI